VLKGKRQRRAEAREQPVNTVPKLSHVLSLVVDFFALFPFWEILLWDDTALSWFWLQDIYKIDILS
jgi:hypothetical protein